MATHSDSRLYEPYGCYWPGCRSKLGTALYCGRPFCVNCARKLFHEAGATRTLASVVREVTGDKTIGSPLAEPSLLENECSLALERVSVDMSELNVTEQDGATAVFEAVRALAQEYRGGGE